jgi:Ricin-type beta-trefoil lectin domain-like
MSSTVSFTSPLTLGPAGPGQTSTGSSQSSTLSAPANVTAAIADDVNGVFSVVTVTSFQLETVVETPDPGEVKGTSKPIRIETAVQVGQSNGVTKLYVASGQFITVTVQFMPTAKSPNNCTATLQITGDTWNPASVSVPLSGVVGAVTVEVPAISVVQNHSTHVDITVSLTAGAPTKANLSLQPGDFSPTQIGNFPLPSVKYNIPPAGMLTLTAPTSLMISNGSPAKWKLAVNADGLDPGVYNFSVVGSAFDGALGLDASVVIKVEVAYFFIQNALGTFAEIEASSGSRARLDTNTKQSNGNSNQLWTFVPDPAGSGYFYIVNKLDGHVMDIQGASTASGSLLEAHSRKVSVDGYAGSDNQLWYFVADPARPGRTRIVSKLNGNVVDVQGASANPHALLDAFPVKLTGAHNQQWSVVDGSFPSVVPTVPYQIGWGNGNINYTLDGNGAALTGVWTKIDFASDFSSSSNGYGFQLNCYSTQGSSVLTVWQQYLIYADPGSNQLIAMVDTWKAGRKQVNNIQIPFADLKNATIPKGYSMTIALTYYQDPQYQYTDQYTAIVTGATYTVHDASGKVVGTQTIGIVGQPTVNSSGSPSGPAATLADLAPITALQTMIVGDINGNTATITQGSGRITYYASSGFTAAQNAPAPSSQSVFGNVAGTGENANLFYGPLPWPWSISMTPVANKFTQLFLLTPGGLPLSDP